MSSIGITQTLLLVVVVVVVDEQPHLLVTSALEPAVIYRYAIVRINPRASFVS